MFNLKRFYCFIVIKYINLGLIRIVYKNWLKNKNYLKHLFNDLIIKIIHWIFINNLVSDLRISNK